MDLLVGFIVALAVGLLIGIERERRKRDPSVGSAGGLRTHVIAALAGAIAVQFPGVAVLVAGAVFVGALVVVAYWRSRSADPGLTSEITLFTTYLLGAMAPRLPELAAAIGVVMALLLALRSVLHGLVSKALSDREVLDLLLLAAAALVIWPLMPDRSIDRYGVINPQTLWELTLLVLMLNAIGYVALRRLGRLGDCRLPDSLVDSSRVPPPSPPWVHAAVTIRRCVSTRSVPRCCPRWRRRCNCW